MTQPKLSDILNFDVDIFLTQVALLMKQIQDKIALKLKEHIAAGVLVDKLYLEKLELQNDLHALRMMDHWFEREKGSLCNESECNCKT